MPDRYPDLFQTIQDPIFVVSPEGKILDANRAALQAAEKTELEVLEQGICKIIHGGSSPHLECPLEKFLRTCSPKVEETRLPGLSGEYLLTISPMQNKEGKVHKILLVARSLTSDEVRKVDSIRTAQLAAIGELAAGVAHEVNNPITGIINFAQLLLDDSEKESLQAELLSRIVDEGERIASIIKNLLSFARDSTNENEPVDMPQVLTESLALIQHQFKKDGIIITTDFSDTHCTIMGNFTQLQQVILNLLSNAKYALNERYTTAVPEKKIHLTCDSFMSSGKPHIRVTLRDLGAGIPQGILDRLFDPFFTTKPSGQGTGLGLSISFGIIQDHGGIIKVDSIIDQYTEMILEIPAKND